MKDSEKWLMGGASAGILAFIWAYHFNISFGKTFDTDELARMMFGPKTFIILLLVSTTCYIMHAYSMYKDLKKNNRRVTGIISSSFTIVGAISTALWMYFYAYDKYNRWQSSAQWVTASLILLFIVPRVVVLIK